MTKADKSPNVRAFIQDAKRFALYNRSVIEQAPLQLYCSALVFALEKSIARRRFENCIPPWIQTKTKAQANWNAALRTLEGHSGRATSVAFSRDGKVVHALFVSNDWVAEGRGNILWLPPDYRATSVAAWNGIAALGHSSGRISFPEFKQGSKLI
jgi:hypothetical protein